MIDRDKRITDVISEFHSFHLECDRCVFGMRVAVAGVVGIGEFNSECVELKCHGGRICANGEKLEICCYESGAVEVIGKITEVCFKYGKGQ